MKQYKFLLKPIFFIFNLLFATWLVITIEKIQPSDFGRHRSFFEKADKPKTVGPNDKAYLIDLCNKYKSGIMDTATLSSHLDRFLAPIKEEAPPTRK